MSAAPPCPTCGSTASVNEYDPDDDVYLYVCDEDADHMFWFENDDEVWK